MTFTTNYLNLAILLTNYLLKQNKIRSSHCIPKPYTAGTWQRELSVNTLLSPLIKTCILILLHLRQM